MSRTQESSTGIKSPCTRWFKWNSDAKCISYYDKNVGEGTNVNVPLPFAFLVLDELTTIGGYKEETKGSKAVSYKSNEVKNLAKDILNVRANGVTIAEGLYKDIKPTLESNDCDFCKSVYIAYKDEEKVLQIGNILIKGASMGPWIEFCNAIVKENNANKFDPWNSYKEAIKIAKFTEEKKGKVDFTSPVFEKCPIAKETMAWADALDLILQDFFAQKKGDAPKSDVQQTNEFHAEVAEAGNHMKDNTDDLPF